jgi:hypothetical protein
MQHADPSMHWLPHTFCVPGQRQVPLMQTWPATVQSMNVQQAIALMQAPLQSFWLVGQPQM